MSASPNSIVTGSSTVGYQYDSTGNVTGLVGPGNSSIKITPYAIKNKSWRTMEALIAAPAWSSVASLAVTVGKTVKHSSGELLTCQTSGTCGASEPALTDSGSITDGTAIWITLGRVSRSSAGVQVPIVTNSATNGSNAISRNVSTNTVLFTKQTYLSGGITPVTSNASAGRYYRWMNNAGTQLLTGGYEFYSDASAVYIQTSGAGSQIRVYVDLLDGYGYRIVEEDVTPSIYYKISWSGSRSNKLYKIVHNMNGSSGMFSGLLGTDSSLDTISVGDLPSKQRTRAIFFGDSFWNTKVPDLPGTVFYQEEQTLFYEVAQGIGIDYIYNMNNGGSGYTTPGTGGTVQYMLQNNQISEVDIDYVFIAAGYNERLTSSATVRDAAVLAWNTARSLYPKSKIIIITAWHNRDATANTSVNEDMFASAFSAWGDKNSILIRPIYSEAYSWISGTGRVGATTGLGNSDYYICTDTVHPSPRGQLHIADHIIYAVKSGLGLV